MIIEYDFGKKERVTSARFAPSEPPQPPPAERPRRLAAGAEMPLERARARAARLETALRAAKAACETKRPAPGHKIMVDADEYARLLRCKALVSAALES
ncbi:hypothetical protein [Methylocella sp.]|uniref:hypothetical protein n=1 Tax=Methylocella sp. TaxID=1978226 RepID=UPI0037847B34